MVEVNKLELSIEKNQTNDDETNQNQAGPKDANKPMSKSQMKKLAKRQKFLEQRKDRRKLEKEKKKSKRRELVKQRLEDGLSPTVPRKLFTKMSQSNNKYRIVIDMDFGEQMTDNEIAKASKQVGRIYALNRHSDNPCQLYVTSLTGKIRDRFAVTNSGYKNWDVNKSEKDYLELFNCDNTETHEDGSHKSSQDDVKKNIIYLTGDAEELLPNVDEILKDDSMIFIIGGLVDHNRHKNLCYQRATERQVRTAKLPIKEHVQLCQRHILSTVTVFEIMLNVLGSHKQWADALRSAIPKRKLVESDDEARKDENIQGLEVDKVVEEKTTTTEEKMQQK